MKHYEPQKKVGLVVVITGHGKGKTTSALGMVLRAIGHGMKVCIVQFIKAEIFAGEYDALRVFGKDVDHFLCGKGFVGIMGDDRPFSEHRAAAQDAIKLVKERSSSGYYDMVVCDEISNAIKLKLVDLSQVLELINCKPHHVHLILTGRDAPAELIDRADTVSEIIMVKHAYEKGIEPQKGIDL